MLDFKLKKVEDEDSVGECDYHFVDAYFDGEHVALETHIAHDVV